MPRPECKDSMVDPPRLMPTGAADVMRRCNRPLYVLGLVAFGRRQQGPQLLERPRIEHVFFLQPAALCLL